MATIDFETLTIDEIKEELTSRGIEFNAKARKNTLSKLLQDNLNQEHEVFTEDDPKNPLEKHEVSTEEPVIEVLLDTTEETKQDSVDKVKTNAEENDDYFAHMNAIERG